MSAAEATSEAGTLTSGRSRGYRESEPLALPEEDRDQPPP